MDDKEVKNLLFAYEMAEKEIIKIRQEYAAVFDTIERLETIKKEALDQAKRMYHTKDGPPEVVPIGSRSHVYARGELFQVRVTYRKNADYYDPAKMPFAMFRIPGVVKAVDTEVCDGYARADRRIALAKVSGTWQSPSVYVERLK